MPHSPIVLFVRAEIELNEPVHGWVDVRDIPDVDLKEYILSNHNLVVGFDFPEARVSGLTLAYVDRDRSDSRTSIVLKDGQDLASLLRWVQSHELDLRRKGVLTQLGQSSVLFNKALWYSH